MSCIHNIIYYNIKLTQKLKPALVASYNIWPGKWRRPILVWVLHKFVTYLLRHLPTYLWPRDPHWATG